MHDFMTTLRLILGDQLSMRLATLREADKAKDVLLMCEVWDETTYVPHHQKKIAFVLSAMRHHAAALRAAGWQVDYVQLEDVGNTGSFEGEVARAVARHHATKVVVTHPGEWRVLNDMNAWEARLGVPVVILDDDRYMATQEEFARWAAGKKQLRMEFFYREMRRKHGVLMEGNQPIGGQWNYDAENRKTLAKGVPLGVTIPLPTTVAMDRTTLELCGLVARRFGHHFGSLEEFHYAVTREGALRVLAEFIVQRLPLFGDYQDTMMTGEPWLWHAHIGLYLNCGLLDPQECVDAAEAAYAAGSAPLNAVEGFIRQILGWREYVRGIYWLKMPGYAEENFLGATRPLPDFYWTGDTPMNCVRQCVQDTQRHAYAHHIQRLMVLGNFALMAGIDPKAVNHWFLVVYADAYEWVELPNVTGMALFADGGLLASKPYAAGGAYIHKMSNYCAGCQYDPAVKTGPKACPLNSLYWDFLARHEEQLAGNPRLGMMYGTLRKMDPAQVAALRGQAAGFLESLESTPNWKA